MISLNEKDFKETISKGLNLVVFTTQWCGYCQQQKAILNELNQIKIYNIDGDENRNLCDELGIVSFPTFILFKDNNIITQFVGLHSKSELLNVLMNYIN